MPAWSSLAWPGHARLCMVCNGLAVVSMFLLLLHCKNKKIGLTQLGLPEFQHQYQRMCIQGDQLHCLTTIGSKQLS